MIEKRNYSLKIRSFLDRCFPFPVPLNTTNEREELAELYKDLNVEAPADPVINLDGVPESIVSSTTANKPCRIASRKKISTSSSSSGSDTPITNLKELQAKQAKNKEKTSIVQTEIKKKIAEKEHFEIVNIASPDIKKSPIHDIMENIPNLPVFSHPEIILSRSPNVSSLSNKSDRLIFSNKPAFLNTSPLNFRHVETERIGDKWKRYKESTSQHVLLEHQRSNDSGHYQTNPHQGLSHRLSRPSSLPSSSSKSSKTPKKSKTARYRANAEFKSGYFLCFKFIF